MNSMDSITKYARRNPSQATCGKSLYPALATCETTLAATIYSSALGALGVLHTARRSMLRVQKPMPAVQDYPPATDRDRGAPPGSPFESSQR
jgi:hypothetical protein